MSRISIYVDNMFLGLPKTEELAVLKSNIIENMEDKFEALLSGGKGVDEAIGIVFSDFGSMEELCHELNIPLEPEQDPYGLTPARRMEYEAFRKNFAFAISCGAMLCILAVAAFFLLWNFPISFLPLQYIVPLVMIAFAVWLFVFYGIQYCRYDDLRQQLADEKKRPEDKKKRENISDGICGIIMMIATIVFLLLGLFKGMWHPAWVILPVCGIICGIVSTIANMRK